MQNYNALNRPFSFAEMAAGFDLSPSQLERITREHRIRPAFQTLDGVRMYGPRECYELTRVLYPEWAAAPAAATASA